MKKKHKFIDTLKSWLLTLGVASVFGIVALGVNATKTYTKTSAYEYQDNGTLIFVNPFIDGVYYDIDLLYSFVSSHSSTDYYVDLDLDIGQDIHTTFLHTSTDSDAIYIYFLTGTIEQYQNDLNYVAFYKDDGVWQLNDNFITGYEYDVSFYRCLPSYTGYQELRNYVLSYNAPQSEGNFLSALTDFMQLLGGAIVQLVTPVAQGVTEFARDLFIDNNHLSILGGVIGIFAGIALAVGITTKVYTWVTSLGN